MIVGAAHVQRVCTVEPEDDPILVVHAKGMGSSKITAQRVQPIPGRHFQVIKPRYSIYLIQFTTHDLPELPGDTSRSLAVDAVPDVPSAVIRQRPNHRIAL